MLRHQRDRCENVLHVAMIAPKNIVTNIVRFSFSLHPILWHHRQWDLPHYLHLAMSMAIKIASSDPDQHSISHEVACVCGTLRNLIEDGATGMGPVPVPVDSDTLACVFEYCALPNDPKWKQRLAAAKPATLLNIVHAANYLDVEPLLDMAINAIGATMAGKSAHDIRIMWKVPNDFTAEETDAMLKEGAWCQ